MPKKTGILSLREHKLDKIPDQVFDITNLTSLDVSNNNLKHLDLANAKKLSNLANLKSFNCEQNKLQADALTSIPSLLKLQNLSAGGNELGKPVLLTPPAGVVAGGGGKKTKQKVTKTADQLFPSTLPPSLKSLKLDHNAFSSIPPQICSAKLIKLVKLDLSYNNLASVPTEISNLTSLTELNLDSNSIVSLPTEVGSLSKLKALSLQNNCITVHSSTVYSEKNPQPIPASVFRDTLIVDLNLKGNSMTSTQLNEFDGYHDFLERRKKIKSKGIDGGALTDLDVCGLD